MILAHNIVNIHDMLLIRTWQLSVVDTRCWSWWPIINDGRC